MIRGNGVILAFAVAAVTACASAGGGAVEGGNDVLEVGRPADNAHTRMAGVRIAQATASQGEAAVAHYEAALSEALLSIQNDPENAKGYLLAGQAAIGTGDWIQADTMFDRAVEMYPGYADQIVAEREQGWVSAYNAGIEEVNAQNIEAARDLFAAADRLYQARPEARMNLGWANMRLGNTEGAIEAYRGALEILYDEPPTGLDEEQLQAWDRDRRVASFNLAQMLAQSGRHAEAARVLGDYLDRNPDIDSPTKLQAMTAQANFLAAAGQEDEAKALMDQIRDRSDLSSADWFQIGIGLFNTGDYGEAADAFAQAAELNPYSRDALLNLVQSLYSEALDLDKAEATPERDARLRENYARILEAADQVRTFDPLNRNLLSFMLRAYRGQADLAPDAEAERYRQLSQDLFREYQAQPYEVADISLSMQGGDAAGVTGVLTNISGTPGESVRLRFNAVDRNGTMIDSEVITVQLPPAGEAVEFQTQLDLSGGEFAGWSYEVLS
ncbi:MAG: tetratricopeptide repeat protein [Gemmatimonadetes bacterium]|nr:tetratricopeptide repeat protein [Gemmatimonadota bacterium]